MTIIFVLIWKWVGHFHMEKMERKNWAWAQETFFYQFQPSVSFEPFLSSVLIHSISYDGFCFGTILKIQLKIEKNKKKYVELNRS